MPEQMSEGHPTIDLLFYVIGTIDEEMPEKMLHMIRKLASSRTWTIGPPEFVDIVDDGEPDDDATEILGGSLRIYSAIRPHELPREIDIAHLQEVEELVAAVRQFSEEKKANFAFELNDEFIGEIENGEIDEELAEGLLGDWRRHLGE